MPSLEQFFKRFFFRLLYSFFSRPPYSVQQLPLHTFKRILIVRQHDQLGDLLIATPAIRAVRKRFPSAYIAIVVREYTAPMMLNNPNMDSVIIFYEKLARWNLSKVKSFWQALRGNGGFDCTIVLNTVSRSSSSDIIALLSKAPYIVGSNHLSLDTSLSEKIYNVVVQRSPEYKTEIERNLDIVRPLGCEMDSFEYDLIPTNEERIEAENIFLSLQLPKNKIAVGVHFGTLDVTRRFPLEKLAQLIDWMIEQHNVEVILIVGPNEIESRTYLLTLLKNKVVSAPLMPLRVFAAFMKHFSLFLCNDTGTLHIASSQRVPTVSFHAMNDPAIWKPPHPRHIAVRAEDTLITSITVEQVKEAINIALNTGIQK